MNEGAGTSLHTIYANKRQTVTLKEWEDVLSRINSATVVKHLGKRGLIDAFDAAIGYDMGCRVCRECGSETFSYGRGRSEPHKC